MKRLWFPCVAVLLILLPASAPGEVPVRIVVLPFTIHARQDMSYLSTEIADSIQQHLKEEGAVVLSPDQLPTEPLETLSAEDFRKFGIRTGADFVIWGSMTRIGDQFSMDAKMMEPFGGDRLHTFFQEGEKIEAIPGMVKAIARSFGLKIFQQVMVADIRIEGNQRIETDAIERVVKTKVGDIYSAKELSRDLKSIYAMGYFDDVRIEAEEAQKGKRVIIKVKEKPTLRVIRFRGNKVFDDEELMENLSLSTGSILNIFKLETNVKRIETLYTEKNYHNVQVAYEIQPLENEQADLTFVIEEGDKIWIEKISFVGNNAYTEKKLKSLLKTTEKGLLSWITSSGDLNQEDLQRDVAKVTAFYHNNGYIKAKVGDPEIEYRQEGIHVTFKVEEGPRFKVGAVDITGDIILSEEALQEKLKISQEEYFSRETVRNDILALSDLYSDNGYAYSEISPITKENLEDLRVDITYNIKKGNKVYFERITIEGNTRTRDKVIRRELDVYEQEQYSGVKLKRGIANLHRLEFFEDINVDTEKGSTDDAMRLNIGVTEKPTGAFSFGGGYSSDESLFAMASISQRNLFGRGQRLELRGQLGGETTRYNLSFVEPWLFDIPLSAGFDLYNWQTEYDDYDKDAVGGRVRFSYPVFTNTRAFIGYTYEIAEVSNVAEDASKTIEELAGENTTSSVKTGLGYDSRDKIFNPTKGSHHGVSVEYAGLGGDVAFTKYEAETGWYIPLLWDTVGFVHGKTGHVTRNSGGILPDYEKFYLGGINSIRGFEYRGIHVTDEDGAEIGGEKFLQFNFEFLIPLIQKAGLMGVLFYDRGNVYGKDDNIEPGDMRESVGYGFRWYSPIGPIRIENGYILDPEPGEDDGGRWQFSMGGAFF